MGIIFLTVFIVLAVVILFMGINIYNNLVSLRNQVDRSFANIDVILKQRFDEIPQLVQVVEQYTQYEQSTINKVMAARSHYGQAKSVEEKVGAANELNLALKGVFALGEAYPELLSNQQFLHMQKRISSLEDQIADRREHFNESVTNLNTRIQQIPDVLFASLLGYRSMELYRVPEAETVRPSLKMNLPG